MAVQVDASATTFAAPLYVAWELTHRCNALCVHCYSSSGPKASTSRDLTTDELVEVVISWPRPACSFCLLWRRADAAAGLAANR